MFSMMRWLLPILAFLLCTAFVAAQDVPPVEVQVRDLAQHCTVRIHNGDTGSGIVLYSDDQKSYILTNAHVADSTTLERIDWFYWDGQPGMTKTPATKRTVARSENRDLALVEWRGKRAAWPYRATLAPAGWKSRQGDKIIGCGCAGGELPTAFMTRVRTVDGASDQRGGQYRLRYDAIPIGGRSGSGVYDAKTGWLIGITSAQLGTRVGGGLFGRFGGGFVAEEGGAVWHEDIRTWLRQTGHGWLAGEAVVTADGDDSGTAGQPTPKRPSRRQPARPVPCPGRA